MTSEMTPDLLDRAEAVATGQATLVEAQDGLSRGDVDELAGLVGAASAVRAHAQAVRAAAGDASAAQPQRGPAASDAGLGTATEIATVGSAAVPGERVTAGTVRPGGARRGRAGSGRSPWLLAATIAVAGGLIAATAFVGGRLSSTHPAEPTTGLVANDPSPRPSPASTPAQVASPPAAAVGLDVLGDLSGVQMMSASVGWGGTSKAILRTNDGGATWTAVHAGLRSITRFVDDMTASFVGPQPFDTIVTTHDGGQTWHTARITPPAQGGPLQLTFASATVGFYTFWADPAHMGALAVFRTDDGGMTWSGPVAGDESSLPSYEGKAEAQGGNAGLIWATPGKADNQPFDNRFSLSADGGATWIVRPFPVDPLAPAADQKAPESIRSDGAGHLLMVIRDVPAIFESHDDGMTWTRVRAWSQAVVIELRSMTGWTAIGLNGSFIDATADAGATWRHTVASRPVSLDTGVLRGGVDVTFGSQDVGLLLDSGQRRVCHLESMQQSPNPDPSCGAGQPQAILSATSDGGRTWRQIAP